MNSKLLNTTSSGYIENVISYSQIKNNLLHISRISNKLIKKRIQYLHSIFFISVLFLKLSPSHKLQEHIQLAGSVRHSHRGIYLRACRSALLGKGIQGFHGLPAEPCCPRSNYPVSRITYGSQSVEFILVRPSSTLSFPSIPY